MGRPFVHFDCIDCGVQVYRKRSADQPRVCVECGILRAAEAARRQSDHTTVEYARLVAATKAGRQRANPLSR